MAVISVCMFFDVSVILDSIKNQKNYLFSRYALGEIPFKREKNLLNEGRSAKWSLSAICAMVRLEEESNQVASIDSI